MIHTEDIEIVLLALQKNNSLVGEGVQRYNRFYITIFIDYSVSKFFSL